MTKQAPDQMVLHDSRPCLEHMLYIRPEMRSLFMLLGISNPEEGRNFQPLYHPEIKNMMKEFEPSSTSEIRVITGAGNLVVNAFVILDHSKPRARTLPVWYLVGNHSMVEHHGVTTMQRTISDYMDFKEFMPDPFCKKIIYVSGSRKSQADGTISWYGNCFTECYRNHWTLGDAMKLPLSDVNECTQRQILSVVLQDLKDSL